MSRLQPFVFALLCLAPLAHAGSLPPITFDPPAPNANDLVTANLPFQICAWTVADSPGHVDINYQLAPCAIGLFTAHIPLGRLGAGSYIVAANQVMPNTGTQAAGPLVVGGGNPV